MSTPSISIHPYFKVHADKMDAAKALVPRFIQQSSTETGVLFYEFTQAGDVVFCREAYVDAAAALKHLENVDGLLKEMLAVSDLDRLEFHGPAAELAKLKEPLKALPVVWFEWQDGLNK